jgi:acyl-CoA dehydrogenase
MPPLDVPRPAWMTEDVVLLEEQARRFIDAEFVPHLERWNDAGIYEREVWTKAGAAGLLCASMPEEYGGAGGSFAHEVAINRALSLAGFDAFGAPLHSGIVARISCITAPRSRSGAGCRGSPPANSSAPSP